MCHVTAMYGTETPTPKMAAHRAATLEGLLLHGNHRGRDSWGVSGPAGAARGNGPFVEAPEVGSLVKGPWLVAANRAAPSLERQAASLVDVPPFEARGWTVAHNGTIANDEALRARFDGATSEVDSAVLPSLLAALSHPTARDVHNHLEANLLGSWALVAGYGDSLVASVNYRPLSVRWDEVGRCWWLTGVPPVRGEGLAAALTEGWQPLTPYSTITLGPDGLDEHLRPTPTSRRVLVVCSGGLDSVTAASWWATRGAEVSMLHITYGCVAQDAEVRAVTAISERMGWPLVTHDLTGLFANLGSALITGEMAFEGKADAEYAHEWVPARNLVLMSVATAVAEGHGFDTLALGANMEEAGTHPDNEQEFIHRLNDVLPFAVGEKARVSISMPVGHLTKREIVQLAVQVGAPLDLTWSCYRDGVVQCGRCGPCTMRRRAFELAGAHDPAPVKKVEVRS